MAYATPRSVDIGRFRVLLSKRLGRGGFGTVYKATDNKGREVAAKEICISDHGEAAAQEAANFYKLKPIKHQNIVEILDVKEFENNVWIFMEQCLLGDLDKYFKEHFKHVQSDDSKINLMTQIANGIEFLHKNSIIHRDIKPANILISFTDGPDDVLVKLTDFGLTRFLDPNATTSAMSTAAGTPLFMAPEFWIRDDKGAISYNWSVDVYAAGLAFLAMIQVRKGKQLSSIIENAADRAESNAMGMAIEQAMLVNERRKESKLKIIENLDEDSSKIKAVKRLIEQMTNVKAKYRVTASQVRAQLEIILPPKPQVGLFNSRLFRYCGIVDRGHIQIS